LSDYYEIPIVDLRLLRIFASVNNDTVIKIEQRPIKKKKYNKETTNISSNDKTISDIKLFDINNIDIPTFTRYLKLLHKNITEKEEHIKKINSEMNKNLDKQLSIIHNNDNIDDKKLDNIDDKKLDNIDDKKLDNIDDKKLDNIDDKKVNNNINENDENLLSQIFTREGKNYICNLCNYKSENTYNFLKHIKTRKHVKNEKKNKYCYKCNKQFDSRIKYTRHIYHHKNYNSKKE
jgi:hypothetical protein